ncbi:hypothetical protein DRN62_03920 [Nanoarchaeota archaeon]|nr:MAG: hypothetical protein DRN62_03920 [Nanoarchaeota archaeon]
MRERYIYLILFFAFIARLFFIYPAYSDENIYFNMAKNMAEKGLVPYRDFFYAHPPFHLLLLFALFKLFGPNMYLGKLLPLLSVLVSSFLLSEIYSLFFKRRKPYLSLLFFFSPQALSFGTVGYGMWPPLMLSLLSIYFFLKKKPLLSALSLIFACFFRYLFLLYFPILITLFREKKKELREFILYFLLFSSSFLLLSLIFGQKFLSQTILYHLKSKMGAYQNPIFYSRYLTMNLPLLFISFLFFLLSKERRLVFYLPFLLDAFLLAIFKVGFAHYFLISLPFYLFILASFEQKDILCLFFFLYVVLNYPSILYHNTPNKGIEEVLRYFEDKKGEVWGDSILMNLVGFKHNLEIPFNEFDSDPIRMELNPDVLERIRARAPDYLVLSENSPRTFFFPGYSQELFAEGLPDFWVFHKI